MRRISHSRSVRNPSAALRPASREFPLKDSTAVVTKQSFIRFEAKNAITVSETTRVRDACQITDWNENYQWIANTARTLNGDKSKIIRQFIFLLSVICWQHVATYKHRLSLSSKLFKDFFFLFNLLFLGIFDFDQCVYCSSILMWRQLCIVHD